MRQRTQKSHHLTSLPYRMEGEEDYFCHLISNYMFVFFVFFKYVKPASLFQTPLSQKSVGTPVVDRLFLLGTN